jgi:hypothetical protein
VFGQVEFKVLSLNDIIEEQKKSVDYVKEMLQLKVRSSLPELLTTLVSPRDSGTRHVRA